MMLIYVVYYNIWIDRKGRLPRGVPNQLMASNNRTSRISANILPSLEEAVFEYCQNGGRLTDPHTFGLDPLCHYPEKAEIREATFTRK